MIVTPDQITPILKGSKTQHRIHVNVDEDRCRHRIGRSYAIQKAHDQPASCRVVVQHIHRERLGDITMDHAKAEGHRTVSAFLQHWSTRHHGEVDLDRDVWAITFVLDRTQPVRLLHRRSERGYTTNPHQALRHEPEAVDDWEIRRFAADGWATYRERQGELHDRLEAALKAAEDAGEDVTRQRLAIERRIQAIERRVQQRAA